MTQKARTLEHYLDLHMMKLGIDKCKRFGNPAVRTRRLHSVINQSRSYILVYRVLSMKISLWPVCIVRGVKVQDSEGYVDLIICL